MEECDCNLKFISEKNNEIADAMLRMQTLCEEDNMFTDDLFCGELLQEPPIKVSPCTSCLDNFLGEDTDICNCNLPLAHDVISNHEKIDNQFQQSLHSNPACTVARVTRQCHEIILRNDKIYVPRALVQPMLQWYHLNLKHPGADRLFATMSQHFYWPNMNSDIILNCRTCASYQLLKRPAKNMVTLPSRTPNLHLGTLCALI